MTAPCPTPSIPIAACGIDCGLCRAYARKRDPCPGCNSPDAGRPAYCSRCVIRNCAWRAGSGGSFCSPECPDFPCRRLRDLARRYRNRYGVDLIGALGTIAHDGWRGFLEAGRRAYTCGDCGRLLCLHDAACPHCGAANPHMPARL